MMLKVKYMVELDETMMYYVYYENPLGWGRCERLTNIRAIGIYEQEVENGSTYAEIVCIEDGEIKESMGTRTRD